MLFVEGVSKSFGGLDVLADVSFTVSPRDRVGLVGPNGAGKSTLLRIIAGAESTDAGSVTLLPGARLAYLPQDARPAAGRTVHDTALAGFADVLALESTQRQLEAEMLAATDEPERLSFLVHEHARVQEAFERRGGYNLEAEVGRVLAGLGFQQEDHERRVETLSGGWQMRTTLAAVLVQKPDILLLDEPTNHLDLAATEWLEEYLSQYPGAVVLVSHDRYLLNAIVGRYLELEHHQVVEYAGAYPAYVAAREQRRRAQQTAYVSQQEFIARQQDFINRNRAGQKHAQAKSREKLLDRMERVEAPRETDAAHFRFPPSHRSGQQVMVLKDVAKCYGQRTVFSDVTLTLERGDRVALLGPNGAGKTTLLRLIGQREEPSGGRLAPGQHVAAGYFSQDHVDQLEPRGTVLEAVCEAAPGWTVHQVRSLLGQLLFSQDDAYKQIATLSGGERARVALARILLRPANLLLLDEPTNHLDLATREALEAALRDYPGTLVFATHDRYLAEQLATKVWEVADGAVHAYRGNYSAYRRQRDAARRAESAALASAPKKRKTADRNGRDDRAQERELARVEERITATERAIANLEQQLADPSHYGDAEQAAELGLEYASRKAEMDVLNRRWEELARAAMSEA